MQMLDEDELSDLDDDSIENKATRDWLAEDDDSDTATSLMTDTPDDPKIRLNPSVFKSLCKTEDFHFRCLSLNEQTDLISTLSFSQYTAGVDIFNEGDID